MAPQSRPDPALGVFETLLAKGNRVQALAPHLERLGTAVRELYGQHLPDNLAERVLIAAANSFKPHRVRVEAVPERGGLAITVAATPVSVGDLTQPVTLRPIVIPGGLGQYKWLDRRLLDELAADGSTPLILDAGEELLEAAWANVWILEGRRVITPPADHRLLAGVTRTLLLDLAGSVGLVAAAEPVALPRAISADALFVTSSVRHAVGAVLAGGDGPQPDGPTVTAVRTLLSTAGWDHGTSAPQA